MKSVGIRVGAEKCICLQIGSRVLKLGEQCLVQELILIGGFIWIITERDEIKRGTKEMLDIWLEG